MLPSQVVEERIRQLASRLQKFSTRITSCHVVVEKPYQSQAQGALFDVQRAAHPPASAFHVD